MNDNFCARSRSYGFLCVHLAYFDYELISAPIQSIFISSYKPDIPQMMLENFIEPKLRYTIWLVKRKQELSAMLFVCSFAS